MTSTSHRHDLDQPLERNRTARGDRIGQRVDLLIGIGEALTAIAMAVVIATLFAPPIDLPSITAVGVLTGLVLLRRILADLWFNRSETAGQTGLMRYRAMLSRAVIQRLPNESSGAIGTLAIEGAEPIAARLGRYPTLRALAIIQPLLVLTVMASIHWPVAAGVLITTPLIPLLMMVIGVGARSASQKQMEALTRLGAHYLDRIRGMETLWMLGGGRAVGVEIESKAEQLRKSTMGVLKLAFLTSAVLEFFSALAIALLAVYIGLTLLNLIDPLFGLTLSPLDGLCLLILAPEFYNPIRRLMAAWHDASEAKSADDKVKAMLRSSAEPEDRILQKPTTAVDSKAVLELTQYRVGFAQDNPLIHAFDLTITRGETQVIFGPSGSGKTQLLNSLLNGQARLDGHIRFQGVAINTLADVRTHVSWMGQHQWFDEGTLHDALTFGRRDQTTDACLAMLERVGLAAQLGDAPLERQLGTRGLGLSGGQLRRLGLARALLTEPTLLILDEPTAHLDADAADQIAALIEALEVTTLLITHDLRFLQMGTPRLLKNQHLEVM